MLEGKTAVVTEMCIRDRVLTPCLLKTFKFRFCRFQTGRTVDLFQLGCKTFIVFIWNIFYGIADKMDNTSLNLSLIHIFSWSRR